MKATKFIAAALVFAAGSAFAADTPAAGATSAAVASAANVSIAASLNVPAITISKNGGRTRADVHAEAVDNVKNYKTPLAVQLELAKNY